jgi:hypothetical protein
MKNIVGSLDVENDDDGCQTNQDNNIEKQLLITLIESELAEIISVNGSLKSKIEKDLSFLDFYI